MLAHALAKEVDKRLMLVDIRKLIEHSDATVEENLQRVFHEARLQNAIILFDEADEMFGDRGYNGAMPTLLREFERLDGIAILATNRGQLLDEALERRILFKLDFDIPTPELREQIWRIHPDAARLKRRMVEPKRVFKSPRILTMLWMLSSACRPLLTSQR